MCDTAVGVYTIGQAPRPDLEEILAARLPAANFEIRGALDGLRPEQIPGCGREGYPLETRLCGGSPVVVDAAFVAPRLQRLIAEQDERVRAHLVLCAGSFPLLTAVRPLIQPFDVAVAELRRLGFQALEVVVPFAAQARPAAGKWHAAGFSCRTHPLGDKPNEQPVATWLADRVSTTAADAAVFDYVGYPAAILEQVGDAIEIPVLDLGHLAIEALGTMLETR